MGRRGRTGALDVEVVDVELRFGVGAACCVERDRDVARIQRVVEDVRTPGSVVVERLCKPTNVSGPEPATQSL